MKCPECESSLIIVYRDEEETFVDAQCVVCGYLSKNISDFLVSKIIVEVEQSK